MADAPWRCSQCGTVNEPVANACRTCGRWPSLFELEGSTLESEPVEERETAEVYDPELSHREVQLGPVSVSVSTETYEEVDDDEVVDEEAEPPKPLWRRLASLIVPIGVVLYILISALANRDAG